jgi:hypothetical protein
MWRREVKTVATVLMIGSWAGDGGLAKDNFCRKAIAIYKVSGHPALYFRYTGDVIDFYGPCDEGPT